MGLNPVFLGSPEATWEVTEQGDAGRHRMDRLDP